MYTHTLSLQLLKKDLNGVKQAAKSGACTPTHVHIHVEKKLIFCRNTCLIGRFSKRDGHELCSCSSSHTNKQPYEPEVGPPRTRTRTPRGRRSDQARFRAVFVVAMTAAARRNRTPRRCTTNQTTSGRACTEVDRLSEARGIGEDVSDDTEESELRSASDAPSHV